MPESRLVFDDKKRVGAGYVGKGNLY